MGSDKLLVLGFDTDKTPELLKRLGYTILRVPEGEQLPDFVARELIDGILVDSAYTSALPELIEFLRGYASTRTVPIVASIDRPRQLQDLKEKRFNRLELMQQPVSIGILASRLATNLRVRKNEGADRSRASLSDVNASLRDMNDRLSREREEAKRIQLALLPQTLPKSEVFDLAVSYRPLEDVGGDWYYFSITPEDKLSFQVADITGHGISAAFIGSMTKLALTASGTTKPGELLAKMNNLMVPVLPEGRFVTMGSFEYDPTNKTLVAAYGGHPAALIWRAQERKLEELKSPGFPLGFEENAVYAEKQLTLGCGDVVIAFTDGLNEAQNRANQMFGSPQISEVLQSVQAEESSENIMKLLFAAFDSFREERLLKDDVTVLILKIR